MNSENKKEDPTGRTLGGLIDDLKNKYGVLPELEEASRRTGRNITDCWNSINGLQNLIDGRVEKMKQDAPCDSNWGREAIRVKNEEN